MQSLRTGADHPRTPRPGARRKMALSRCKGGPGGVLLAVKSLIGWRARADVYDSCCSGR